MDNDYRKIVEPFVDTMPWGETFVEAHLFDPAHMSMLADVAPELADKAYGTLFALRDVLVRKYSWSIPDRYLIEAFAEHSPILSVGAGTAYIEHLLSQAGADVIATDAHVWPDTKYQHGKPWMPIEHLDGVAAAQKYPDRALMLSWPSHRTTMASEALEASNTSTVLYIGEGPGGCTGDEKFFELLAEEFELVRTVRLLSYHGIHDEAEIWRRRDDGT